MGGLLPAVQGHPVPKGYGDSGTSGGGLRLPRDSGQAGVQDPQRGCQADGGHQTAVHPVRGRSRAVRPRKPDSGGRGLSAPQNEQ